MEKAISNKHFSKLCNTFLSKITIKELEKNPHLKKYPICISMFILNIKFLHDKLLLNYKRNDKSKSCVILDITPFRIYVNYTFEDSNNKRIKKRKPTDGDKLVFRVFFQNEKYKKKLVSRWNVKINTRKEEIEPKIELDIFHYHETMDRIYCIMKNINSNLSGHPVISQNLELETMVENIIFNLYDVYSKIGEKILIEFPDEQDIITEDKK